MKLLLATCLSALLAPGIGFAQGKSSGKGGAPHSGGSGTPVGAGNSDTNNNSISGTQR